MSSPPIRGLIHTEVFLGWLTGQNPAVTFLLAVNRMWRPCLSQWSAMEMLAFARDQPERDNIRQYLTGCQVHPITALVARRAHAIVDQLAPPSSLSAADAIIAATALAHKLPLYTLDPARFAAVPGLTAIRP